MTGPFSDALVTKKRYAFAPKYISNILNPFQRLLE